MTPINPNSPLPSSLPSSLHSSLHSSRHSSLPNAQTPALPSALGQPTAADRPELQEKFTEFVGQTMFGSMLASMRKSVGKPPYMHGGRTEEVFQQQLDQHIVKDLTEASADSFSDPMFELFNLQRRA